VKTAFPLGPAPCPWFSGRQRRRPENYGQSRASRDSVAKNQDSTCLKANSYEGARHKTPLLGPTYGVVWRGDESPLQIIAHRCALAAPLRGQAPERSPKPGTFMIRCNSLAMAVGIGRVPILSRHHGYW